MVSTNLRVLCPSRKKLRVGDIFAMQLPDERYLFGRVILVDLSGPPKAPMPRSNLLYIYKDLFDTKTPDIDRLAPDRLLIPPVFTNRLGWVKGVFEMIDNRPLQSSDLLPQHCFRDFSGKYYDENMNLLPAPIEPCGSWGLASYLYIDDQVSQALGLAPVSE